MTEQKIVSPEFFRIFEETKIEPNQFKKLIVAIPEVGLVSILVARKLIKELKMKRVGFIISDPTSIIIRYENKRPEPVIRLFAKEDILLLLYEAPINSLIMVPLANLIIKLLDEKNIDLPIMLASAPSQTRLSKSDSDISVIGAPIGEKAVAMLEKVGVDIVNNGMLSGPFAYVLNDRLIKGKNALVLLSETYPTPFTADPASAAKLLEVLSKMLDISIDTSELLERAEELRLEMRKLEQTMRSALPKEISELYT